MVVTVMLAAALYLIAVILADGPAVQGRLASLSPATIGVALALPTAGYLVRFVRWAAYMRVLGHRVPVLAHLQIYLAGFALTATPGKVGENLRALYLRPYGVPASHSVAAFVAERLGDLVAMTLLAGLALDLAVEHSWWIAGTSALTVTVLAVIRHPGLPDLIDTHVRGRGRLSTLLRRAVGSLRAARQLLSIRLLVVGLGLALLAWSAEAWTFGFLSRSLGIAIAIPTAMGVFAVATLLGAVSFLPGGVGPTEAVMGGLLVISGASVPDAAAVTVLIRAVTLWWAVLLGVAATVGLRFPDRSLSADLEGGKG
jgi:uncharacterized membrane protein YbhN (UPF0104 family)